MELGLQTFTVRRLMQTPEQLEKTFAAIAAMGYNTVELAVDYLAFAFTTKTAEQIAQAARQNGIRVVSCQIKEKTAAADVAATAAFLHTLGAQIVTNSVIDVPLLAMGKQGVVRYCARLNELHNRLAQQGIVLAHHNHQYEFLRMGGDTVLSILAQEFVGAFVLDTYWCRKAGEDPVQWLGALKNRVPVIHLRDYRKTAFGGKDAALGKGCLPLGTILKTAQQTGVQAAVVEQNTNHALRELAYSIQHCKTIWPKW